MNRQKMVEAILICASLVFSYAVIEFGYRLYVYYSYAVQGNYSVQTIDVRQPPERISQPRDVLGPNRDGSTYSRVYYNGLNEIFYRHKVHINNLGWTSRHDYSVAKSPDEFRIVVVGGSTTAAVTNELAWTDVAQDQLNADKELKDLLGVTKFSVLNLSIPGAGMGLMARPLAVIAHRFSPDLLMVNFSIENATQVVNPQALSDFKLVAETPVSDNEAIAQKSRPAELACGRDAPLTAQNQPCPGININGIEIPLQCVGSPYSLSNLNCKVSNTWYVQPGREFSPAEMAEIKKEVARQRLLYNVLLSWRPLALLELMGQPLISRASATTSVAISAGDYDEMAKVLGDPGNLNVLTSAQ